MFSEEEKMNAKKSTATKEVWEGFWKEVEREVIRIGQYIMGCHGHDLYYTRKRMIPKSGKIAVTVSHHDHSSTKDTLDSITEMITS